MQSVLNATIPLYLIIILGFLSKKFGIFKMGDERVLTHYVYYIALPALIILNIGRMTITRNRLDYIGISILPFAVALTLILSLYLLRVYSKKSLYLLIFSTVFGNLAFLGIPFVSSIYPSVPDRQLIVLSAIYINTFGLIICLVVLEIYRMEKWTLGSGLQYIIKKLVRNPLILSFLTALVLATLHTHLPDPVSGTLEMLGRTSSPLAVFMLGTVLSGRKYHQLFQALKLSLIRLFLLPALALFVSVLFGLLEMESTLMVLMHGMPAGVSLIILSERYDFYRQTIPSMVLISLVGSALSLNLWLILLRAG
jgi:malonate transporter